MNQTFRDEFSLASITVGRTRDRELNSILGVYVKGKGQGFVVNDGPECKLHYYTNKSRKATLCVGCRKGLVEHIRLKKGLWGPLKQLQNIPEQAVSGCSLECLGTSALVHLNGAKEWSNRARVLEKYGPAHRETSKGTGSTMSYRWAYGSIPRALTIALEGGRIIEIFLEQLHGESHGFRPLAAPAPFRRSLPLPPHPGRQLEQAEEMLRQGRFSESERMFESVALALEEADPLEPSFLKAHVLARTALCRAHAGSREALTQARGCRDYLRQWDGAEGHYTLDVTFTLARIEAELGKSTEALKTLNDLWDTLQGSHDFYDPHLQWLARQVAGELARLGAPQILEEVQREDDSRA